MSVKQTTSHDILKRPVPNYNRLQARSLDFADEIAKDGTPRYKFEQPLVKPKLYSQAQIERLERTENIGLMSKVGSVSLVGAGDVTEILRRGGLNPQTPHLATRVIEATIHALGNLGETGGLAIDEAAVVDIIVGEQKTRKKKRRIDVVVDPRGPQLRETRHALLEGLGEALGVDVAEFREADHEFKVPVGSKYSEGARLSSGAINTILSPSLFDLDQLHMTPFAEHLRDALNRYQQAA